MMNQNPLVDPIVVSTVSAHNRPGQMGYGRVDNPTRLNLEKRLAQLEGAKYALAFASGSSAIAAVFTLLSTGDKVLSHTQVYEGTERMLQSIFKRFGIQSSSVDFTNARELERLNKQTNMMICETITNPCLDRLDIKTISMHKQKSILVVDNTMATPECIHPLQEGADIVVHSLTKFIGGHHDVIAGAIMTNNRDIFERLRHIQWTLGAIPGPNDSFLVLRGIETLSLRMKEIQINAKRIADFLEKNTSVEKTVYPGISGMISFWIKGDKRKSIRSLIRLKHIRITHSFGGVTTTVLHPKSMMTWTSPPQVLRKQGITENLVRMSVGVEDPRLVINDLRQALNP